MSDTKSVPTRFPLGRQGDPNVSESIVCALWDTPSAATAFVGGVLYAGASVLTCSATAATVLATGLSASAAGLSVVASKFILVSEATVPTHTAHFTAGQIALCSEYEDDDYVHISHPITLIEQFEANSVD
jgi:hypothetical protein